MSFKQLTFSFGSFTFIVSKKHLLISVQEHEPRVRRRLHTVLGRPCLHDGGKPADHLTIPFTPCTAKPHRGLINIHLTWRDPTRRRKVHRSIAHVEPERFTQFGQDFTRRIVERQQELTSPVSLEELTAKGYVVVGLKGETYAAIEASLSKSRPRFRLKPKQLERRIVDEMEFYNPAALDRLCPEFARGQPLFLAGPPQGETEEPDRLKVAYYPRGFFGRPPGWYTLPSDEAFTTVIDAVFAEHLGPDFYRALAIAARELEADVDLDLIKSHVPSLPHSIA